MAGITRSLVGRHALGRSDAYDAALLDVAQDHLLFLLDQAGLFNDERLTFKGGTSLRKCRLGNDGRFSTDLDFAAPDDDVVLEVCDVIHGSSVAGFSYALESSRGDGRHWKLTVTHEELGTPNIAASVEFARRPLALLPERLAFVQLPIHKNYGFDLPTLPVAAEAEACAEKLARYRRVALSRDLYDLNHLHLGRSTKHSYDDFGSSRSGATLWTIGAATSHLTPKTCCDPGASATINRTRSECLLAPSTSPRGSVGFDPDSHSSERSIAMSNVGPHATNASAVKSTRRSRGSGSESDER